MRRHLTAREWVLLALLGVILVICGYMLLLYIPQTTERDFCLQEAESVQAQTQAARLRLEEKQRMEQELEALFSADTPPQGIADYDNIKPIMVELNPILALTTEFKLTFSMAETSQPLVRRSIAVSFTADSYERAKTVLQRLHDSGCRCMLENVNLNLNEGAEGPVQFNGTLVFFEYQALAPTTEKPPQPQQNAGTEGSAP